MDQCPTRYLSICCIGSDLRLCISASGAINRRHLPHLPPEGTVGWLVARC